MVVIDNKKNKIWRMQAKSFKIRPHKDNRVNINLSSFPSVGCRMREYAASNIYEQLMCVCVNVKG